ncbi:uncharacterized protein LOC111386973 [Olea europaea var. sylvestris]|uniref:uncharacterized protein LOC111386973 n=1 Tax=Olea europaea var. sylvestris TaxID=158386 RepID=UPI000C1D120E|nr:uncharacterized protein LOC111386973 [Olea europaea var. sylvestris]
MATDSSNQLPHILASSSTSNSAIVDGSSPYFLHHSDNPGLIFVSQPLTGDNYESWSRAMVIALSVKNKSGFIDGSIPKPKNSDDLLNPWICNNNMDLHKLKTIGKGKRIGDLYVIQVQPLAPVPNPCDPSGKICNSAHLRNNNVPTDIW